MGEAVDERDDAGGVRECGVPVFEGKFGGDDDGAGLFFPALTTAYQPRHPPPTHRASLFPEFKGKRVKLATVNVRLDGRRAVAVARASFTFMTFDANGIFDSTEWEAATEATIATWTVPTLSSTSPVIDARAQFADRRYQLEHTWEPSDDLRRQLFATATANRATYH